MGEIWSYLEEEKIGLRNAGNQMKKEKTHPQAGSGSWRRRVVSDCSVSWLVRGDFGEVWANPGTCLYASPCWPTPIYLYASPCWPTPIYLYASPCWPTPIYLYASPCWPTPASTSTPPPAGQRRHLPQRLPLLANDGAHPSLPRHTPPAGLQRRISRSTSTPPPAGRNNACLTPATTPRTYSPDSGPQLLTHA
ncbi:unnamed protein product [Arctogadus glacialis]